MMKKVFVIALSFMACISLVQAKEAESWVDDNGLSGSICVWKKVSPAFVTNAKGIDREAWIECSEEGCTHKFCSEVQSTLDGETIIPKATTFWEKDMCNKYCITLQEKLPIEGYRVKSISGESGVDLLGNYFGLWYKIGALILGLICVLVIVISGVQIIFGGASEESVTSAKTRIWGALLSLILLFSSALILKTINPLFFT